MSDPKFWSDELDMDLPKVIPEAKQLLGAAADMELVTTGSTTHGRLNHPSCWNHDLGNVAFFGRESPARPSHYWCQDAVVKCTLWEAVRDAWCHDVVIVFETRTPIWDGSKTRLEFDQLMSHMRKWTCLPEWRVNKLKEKVRLRLELVPYLLDRAMNASVTA